MGRQNKSDKKVAKMSSEVVAPPGDCWYAGMTHMQLYRELAVDVFPHGKQQKKQKKNH